MGYTKDGENSEYVSQKYEDETGIAHVLCIDEDGDGWVRGETTHANARLIAAAPCLLEALERVVACAYNVGGEHVTDHQPLIDASDFAMSIITRAKGEN